MSDLLLKDTAIAMTQRGPRPRLVEFEGVGHAPMLMAEDQIKVVRDFLLENQGGPIDDGCNGLPPTR